MSFSPQKSQSSFRLIAISVVLVLNVFSSSIANITFSVPVASADYSSFSGLFEDCTDDSEEITWPGIKRCLDTESMSDEHEQRLWVTVIRPKLDAFYSNHAIGEAAGLPDAVSAKPYVYGSTPPEASKSDAIISAYLSEEFRGTSSRGSNNSGLDALQEIGDFLDYIISLDSEAAYLCFGLLQIPVGGPSRNSNDVPDAFKDDAIAGRSGDAYQYLVRYGPNGNGDVPRCTRTDILRNDEKPYLISRFAAANIYMLADLVASDQFDITSNIESGRPDEVAKAQTIKRKMLALKNYIANASGSPQVQVVAGATYLDLAPYLSQEYSGDTDLIDDGPIENLLEACQDESTVQRSTEDNYVRMVLNCYRDKLATLPQAAKEFVENIIIPATESYDQEYSRMSSSDKEIVRIFMKNSDYVQLGEGYDPLAVRKFDYRMRDYLNETIRDGYTDNSDWVDDGSDVSISANVQLAYSFAFDNTIKVPVLKHLKAINDQLIAKASDYLDRPLPASNPPIAPAASGPNGGITRQDFRAQLQIIQRVAPESRKNILAQLNTYITNTITNNKSAYLFTWYWLAVNDHDPNYPEAVAHNTGNLSLLVEDAPATGAADSVFTDPYLAAMTNACSPNFFFDSIDKDDLPIWKRCLEYEKDFVDHSDSNRTFAVHQTDSTVTFSITLANSAVPLNMGRSAPARTALQALITRIDACFTNPLCLSLNDRDEGTRANQDAGLTDNGVDTGNALLNTILSLINVMLALIIKFFFWLTGMVMALFQAVLSYSGFTTSDFVVTMWKAVRDFVNLFFILALLGIAVANIVQYEINNYAIKTILPKLIVIVIAVNFSRLFVGVVVDATNVVEAGVYQVGGMGPHGAGTSTERCSQYTPAQVNAGGWRLTNIPDDIKQGSLLCRLATGLKFEEMQRYAVQNNPNQPGRQIDFFFANVALLLMVVMIFFGFLALAITFSIRIVILWALAITSPLYVVSKLSPLTQSIGGQWQSKFFKYATMHVGVAFFMTLAVLAADSIVPNLFSAAMQTPGLIAGSQLGPAGFSSLADYLKLGFIIAMVYAGVFTAAKGDYAQGFIDKVAGFGSPSAIWGYTKKGAGFGYNLSQNVGTAMREKRGDGISRLIRGAGFLLSAPSTTAGAAKKVYEDIQSKAKERSERFALQGAARLSGGGFTERGQRFRSKVVAQRESIISDIEKLESTRYDSKTLTGRMLQQAIDRGDMQALIARGRILASRGDLDMQLRMRDGKTLEEHFRKAESGSGITPEEVNNTIERLVSANTSALANKRNLEASLVSNTTDTIDIFKRSKEARKNNRGAQFVAIAAKVLGNGRMKDEAIGPDGKRDEGIGLMMREILLAQAENPELISEDGWRYMSREVAGNTASAFAVRLKDRGKALGYFEEVYAAARDMGLVTGANLQSDMANRDEASRTELAAMIGHLASEASYKGRYLSEQESGRRILRTNAELFAKNIGTPKLDGDDDRIYGTVQSMDMGGAARAAINNVENAPQQVVRVMDALARNIINTQGNAQANAFSEQQLNEFLQAMSQLTSTRAQIERMNFVVNTELKNRLTTPDPNNRSLTAAQVQSLIDRFNNQFLAQATAKRDEEERKAARIKAEEEARIRSSGGSTNP